MGDRIAVMSLGILQQLATPQELYDVPNNKFVAGFIGSPSMNFIDVTIQGQDSSLYAVTPAFRMRIPEARGRGLQPYIGQTVTMGIRPEHLAERSRANGSIGPDMTIPVKVDVIELLGNEIFVYLDASGMTITARMDPETRLERGQDIEVAANPDKLHFFDPKSEAAIR
jgi:multiple sugar transport system ATP-binding protein